MPKRTIRSKMCEIQLPAAEAESGGWAPYPLFQGATPSLVSMHCHYSVLSAGHSPHPPHIHVEDELLIVLDGSAEILLAQHPDDPTPTVHPMTAGQFAYYPAGQHHTLRNASPRPVTYLMFKWANSTKRNAVRRAVDAIAPNHRRLATATFDPTDFVQADDGREFAPTTIFDGRTRWLGRLHGHLTRLTPGGGYAPHFDPYDVAIVLLDGTIEIGDQRLDGCGVAYFSEGQRHGMHNPGEKTATYLVFELEASDRRLARRGRFRRRRRRRRAQGRKPAEGS